MKKLLFFFPIFLCLLGCSDSDDPSGIDFKLSSDNPEVTISDKGRNASLNVLGYNTDYILNISGDFVNIVFDSEVNWLSASYSLGTITLHADAIDNSTGNSRTGKVNFTVFNDSKSASGSISVTQRVITYEDLRALEDEAINYYLSKQKVMKQIPANNNFQTGEDAPFYYLSTNPIVAMKVIDKGSDEKPKDNDRVYFRFSRGNLISYMQTGGELFEDFNSILGGSPCYFKFNDFTTASSAQWGKGIQMPFLYGLGYNAHVQLVVASPLGAEAEISNVTPFIYNIQYYKAEGEQRDEIPSSLVYIPFKTQTEWSLFAPMTALDYSVFDKARNLPSGYTYTSETYTGFGGVLVVCDFFGMQLAYDLACPVECDANTKLSIDAETMEAVCPVCGSHYNVFGQYGAPVSGKAVDLRCGMVRYTINSPYNFYKIISN